MKSNLWYRNAWVWLIIALPVSSVIFGIFTIIITNQNQPDMVIDDYYKKGKAINQELTLYDNAVTLGVQLEFKIDDHRLEIRSPINYPALKVNLVHSTLADKDISLILTPNAMGTVSSTLDSLIPGKWQIIVMPMDISWKVRKQISLPNSSWVKL